MQTKAPAVCAWPLARDICCRNSRGSQTPTETRLEGTPRRVVQLQLNVTARKESLTLGVHKLEHLKGRLSQERGEMSWNLQGEEDLPGEEGWRQRGKSTCKGPEVRVA